MTPIVFTKGLNLNLMKSLDPAAICKKCREKRNMLNCTISIQLAKFKRGNSTGRTAQAKKRMENP